MDDNTADDESEAAEEPVYKKGPNSKRSFRKRRVSVSSITTKTNHELFTILAHAKCHVLLL